MTNLKSAFADCYSLKEVNLPSTQNVTSFIDAFKSCFSLERINELDFNSCTDSSVDISCNKLINIGSIKNIKMNFNVSGSPCLHKETLLRILNALYDYSTSEATYTLALGTANLSKLTDEEIAIATNKGWNVS